MASNFGGVLALIFTSGVNKQLLRNEELGNSGFQLVY
jgi:hypothetical protein